VNYEPNSLGQDTPRENARAGFTSVAAIVEGPKARHRSDTFADHFSQARQFFDSQTEPEQNHIVAALTFELSKVETDGVRAAVLAQLANIRQDLAARVADGLGEAAPAKPARAALPARTDLPASPALSILAKAPKTLKGRKVGVLVADGTDPAMLASLRAAVEGAGGKVAVVAPKVGGAKGSDGKPIRGDFQLAGGPSVLFDAVVVAVSPEGGQLLATQAAAVAWVHDAFAHLKVIGHTPGADALLQKAGVIPDDGIIALGKAAPFTDRAAAGRIWAREPSVRMPV
jgi:catalase